MTKKKDEKIKSPQLSSSPCSMSEVDPHYMGLADPDPSESDVSKKPEEQKNAKEESD